MFGKISVSVLFVSGWLGAVPCLAEGHFIVGDRGDSLGHVAPARLEVMKGHGAVAWNVSLYGMGGTGGRCPFTAWVALEEGFRSGL